MYIYSHGQKSQTSMIFKRKYKINVNLHKRQTKHIKTELNTITYSTDTPKDSQLIFRILSFVG